MFVTISVLMISCVEQKPQEEEPVVLTISEFLLQGDELDNTIVHVQGKVDHLCRGSRAKIHFICPADHDESIKIFADEEMGEFSDTLVGMVVRVTGLVAVSTTIDDAYLDEWEAELAEKGEEHHHHHHHGDEEEHGDHDHEDEVHPHEKHHHHGNQHKQIEKYRQMIKESGKGYINLYKIVVSEIQPAE